MSKNEFLWRRIYSTAKQIYNLAPWHWLYEDDIFGVKIPDSGELYFISVMGSGGEFTAISAYRGPRALGQFWELFEKDPQRPEEYLLTMPHFMLSFEDRNLLRPEHIERIKASGLTFRGKGSWPVLDEVVPGYVPALPKGSTLADAAIVLEQVLDVAKRAEGNEELIFPESYDDDVYLIREMKGSGSDNSWTDQYRTIEMNPVMYQVKYREDMISALNTLPRKPHTLQVDLVMLPTPVKDKDSGDFIPFALLLCNKKSGIVEGMQILQPKPDLDTMYESLPQELMELLMRNKYLPRRIELRSEIMLLLLPEMLGKAGIEIGKLKKLDSIDQTVKSLLESL